MLIRPVQESDFAAIAELTNHYIAHTAIHFGYDVVTAEELHGVWLKTRERYPFLIAEVNGAFAGYCKAGVWRDRTAYQWTPESGIYVVPDAHRRGVGRALYLRLFEALARQGFHSVIGGITLPNEPSVRLHEAVGFVKVAHIARAGWKFDRWWDVGFWQKSLAEASAAAKPLLPPM